MNVLKCIVTQNVLIQTTIHLPHRNPAQAFCKPYKLPTVVVREWSSDSKCQSDHCGFFFSHSSGVWHFGVQACIAAISSLSAALTKRCRASVVFLVNCGDTIMASYIWPQPPTDSVSCTNMWSSSVALVANMSFSFSLKILGRSGVQDSIRICKIIEPAEPN